MQSERVNLELTKKNEELRSKIHEVDLLKRKYEDAMNEYQGQTTKLITRMTLRNSTVGVRETYSYKEEN